MDPRGKSPRKWKVLAGLALSLMLTGLILPSQSMAATNAVLGSSLSYGNIAPQATITASSQTTSTGQTAVKAADNVVTGYPGDYTKEWATYGGKAGSWIRFAWPKAQLVSKIVLYDRPNGSDQITAATISFSDGSSISTGTLPNNGAPLTLSFSARQITWAKLTVTGVSRTTKNIGLAEIEVWGTVDNGSATTPTTVPQPTTTTTVAPTTTTSTSTTTTVPSTTTSTTAPTVTSTTAPTTTGGTGRVIRVTSSLQAAVNAAAPGDSIYVPSGTWAGSIALADKSDLTIYGDGAASVIGVIEIDGCSNIVIHDLTIQDSYSNNWIPGILINTLAGGHFYNLTFVGMGHSCINAAGPAGSWDPVITNVEVDHCTAPGPIGEYGFYVGRGCSNWSLHDNSIGQCVGKTTPPHQFYIQDSVHIKVENNYSYGTTKSNGFAYKAGIGDDGPGHSYDIQFNGNTSVGCYGGLWLVGTQGVTATGNKFLSCTNQAVQFWSNARDITLQNNTMSSTLYGITFATDSLWASNISLINNNVTAPIPLSLGGGQSSMIVLSSGNSF